MNPRPPLQPRKAPRQARSKATVEAILEATTRILSKEGWEAASTNRVAQVAGVSVGSLYQYFPNKASLLRALNDRHTEALLQLFGEGFLHVWDAPLQDAVETVLEAYVAAHRMDPELHRILVTVTPQVEALEQTRRLERAVGEQLEAWLRHRAAELRPLEPKLAAFLIVQAVEAMTHAAVLEPPEALGRRALKDSTLVKEAARMVLGYLGRPEADSEALADAKRSSRPKR